MLTRNYNFKAKNRAYSNCIFSPKESVTTISNPLEQEEKKYEPKKSKSHVAVPSKSTSRIISNVSFDPLSDPLSGGQGDSSSLTERSHYPSAQVSLGHNVRQVLPGKVFDGAGHVGFLC